MLNGDVMIKIIVPGDPVAQGRPRFAVINGRARAYDPAKSRAYKDYVKLLARQSMGNQSIMQGPVKIDILVNLPIPASKPKKWAAAALSGAIRPAKKPDIDNFYKCMTDALNGIVYQDDSQIVAAAIQKRYAAVGSAEIEIEQY